MKVNVAHLKYVLMVFFSSFLAGIFLLPFLRTYPESIHNFFRNTHPWLRYLFLFSLSTILCEALFKLFSPRPAHLRYLLSHPPAWLACLLGTVLVAVADLRMGFTTAGYHATLNAWLINGALPFTLVAFHKGFIWDCSKLSWRFIGRINGGLMAQWKRLRSIETRTSIPENASPFDVHTMTDESFEKWLSRESPAEVDLFHHQPYAERLISLLREGTPSIGLIGPFGSGKSTIIEWVKNRILQNADGYSGIVLVPRSCWGFETSASAIQDMLNAAIGELAKRVDTSSITSLPDAYRQTFSAGGEWIDTLSNIVLGKRDANEQFERLSVLLTNLNLTLVFVIEDLDRNESRSFDRQEVLAFLQQLREHQRMSFILVGDFDPRKKIDFAKLCDQTVHIKPVNPDASAAILLRMIEMCQCPARFQCERFAGTNTGSVWHPFSGSLLRDFEEFSPSQAAATVLSTPRSLRQALGRVWITWKSLNGEIHLDHLVALTILRVGAPQCFQFLCRRWDRLKDAPKRDNTFGPAPMERIKKSIRVEWNEVITALDCNVSAILVLVKMILPSAADWLTDDVSSGGLRQCVQGLSQERYWYRGVNEYIEPDEIRDQRVLAATRQWIELPSTDSVLVNELTTSEEFGRIWADLAAREFFEKKDKLLLLCEHVLSRIRTLHGANSSWTSLGFQTTHFFAISSLAGYTNLASWLMRQIEEAGNSSLSLVNGIWHFWATEPWALSQQDRENLRVHVHDVIKEKVRDADSLNSILGTTLGSGTALYDLIFDEGNKSGSTHTDVACWNWLGPILLEALRKKAPAILTNMECLLSTSAPDAPNPGVNHKVLLGFFRADAAEIVELMSSCVNDFPEANHPRLEQMISAGRQLLLLQERTGIAKSDPDQNDEEA